MSLYATAIQLSEAPIKRGNELPSLPRRMRYALGQGSANQVSASFHLERDSSNFPLMASYQGFDAIRQPLV